MQITNAATGAVLSTQTVSSFQSGIYLDYAISGNVLITFTRLAGQNAVLNGLFIDPASVAASSLSHGAVLDTVAPGGTAGGNPASAVMGALDFGGDDTAAPPSTPGMITSAREHLHDLALEQLSRGSRVPWVLRP